MIPLRTRTITPIVLLVAPMALALSHCGDKARCDTLRDETYQKRRVWAECVSDDECFPLAGNPRDCTGVLTCPFAVHRKNREEAEQVMLKIGDDSVDCHVCAVPNCNGSTLAHCEPITHQCVMVDLVDAGLTFGPAPGPPANLPDAEIPPPDDTDAGAE